MKNRPFYIVALIATLLAFLAQWQDPAVIREHLESKTYDLRMRLREQLRPSPRRNDIVIVAIDEKSLEEYGRWPWSRTVTARLVQAVSSGHPRTIGIDIFFSEPESPEADAALAAAVKAAGNAVLPVAFSDVAKGTAPPTAEQNDLLWDAAFMEVKTVPGIPWKQWAIQGVRPLPPRPAIAHAAAALGHVTSHPDMDGVMRWEIMAVNHGDDAYPSLALQIARLAQGLRQEDLGLYGGSNIRFGERFIPTDLSNRVLINYYGPEGSFPYISAADLLSGQVKSEVLAGKVVLIGTSALATYDQKVSPFSAEMPGVEKNATVVENILTNRFMRKSPGVVELAVILSTSILLSLLLPRLSARNGVVVGFSFVAAYIIASEIACLGGIWLSLIYPLTTMMAIVTTQTVTKLLFEEKQSRQIRAMFSSYVTERLVDEMIRNPKMAQLGGQKREVTVLFSDVVEFAVYSENHQPEEVVAILNEYLGAMTDIVLKWEGILDKFVGDAIVVFWGAPMKQDDHAERAVRCALEMQKRLEQLRLKWEAEGRAPLFSGIGLNSGEAIVGNIGAEGKKMDYTVIGDHVNLGARVEGLTRRYNAKILITEYTLEKLRPGIASGLLRGVSILGQERVIVKGKDIPVGIFSLNPLDSEAETVVVECDPEKVVRLTEK
ncbi:MAG TPA: adenylate/guanylate cyclase domain-containing protein [Desulfuromonadales bacterium]|nr:adenylate/guanylate cyclase domain-containing protein [Desulfuromonadales bacterium]